MKYRNRTEQIIMESRTPKGSWTHAQWRLWGVDPKNPGNWKERLIKADALKNYPHPGPTVNSTVTREPKVQAPRELDKPDLSTPWGRLTRHRSLEKSWNEVKSHYGYIYLIESNRTGRKYVGLHSSPAREEGWRNYMSSSPKLALLYSEAGKENFSKSWLAWANNRTELVFLEGLFIVALDRSGNRHLNGAVKDFENMIFKPKNTNRYLASKYSKEINELRRLGPGKSSR